jgi:hypothetical protein
MAVKSPLTWPFLMDVAKPVARSQENWPICRSTQPIPRRPTCGRARGPGIGHLG